MDSKEQLSVLFENLLFPEIFRTFKMAIHPSKVIIAFLAIVALCLAGWIMDFSSTVAVAVNGETELSIYLNNPEQLETFIERTEKRSANRAGVFGTLWKFGSAKFNHAAKSLLVMDLRSAITSIRDYFKAIGWAVRYHSFYCTIFFLIKITLISLAGGAICRVTALQFSRGEKPGLTEAIGFGAKKFTSFLAAPLLLVGIIIFIGLFIFVLGLIGNIPWVGELVIAIALPLALVAGALIAAIAIGMIVGFNLMFPTIAYEGTDSCDAINRSINYVYTRPWRTIFYTFIASVYGSICYLFVRFLAFLLLFSTWAFLQMGVWAKNANQVNKLDAIWPEPEFMNLLGTESAAAANGSQAFAAFWIHLCLLVVVGLVVSFVVSFYFSANTVIYALLRNKVDGTQLDQVYTKLDDEPLTTPD
ncbi:hypothetical protein ACFL3G_11235 [Planctomycetota bacterium]